MKTGHNVTRILAEIEYETIQLTGNEMVFRAIPDFFNQVEVEMMKLHIVAIGARGWEKFQEHAEDGFRFLNSEVVSFLENYEQMLIRNELYEAVPVLQKKKDEILQDLKDGIL